MIDKKNASVTPPNWKRAIVDQSLKSRIILRSKMINRIRQTFLANGFLELDTPVMVESTEFEPFFEPFVTYYKNKTGGEYRTYLVTSPEIKMKMAVSAGFGKIFQISKFFRNGDLSNRHNPEFMGLEWYETHTTYEEQMIFIENFIYQTSLDLTGPGLIYQDTEFDLTPPWPRITFQELIYRHTGIDVLANKNRTELYEALKKLNIQGISENNTWEELIENLLVQKIDPTLGWRKPVFVINYPNNCEFSLLAKSNRNNPAYVDRFELYIAGIEIADGFTELDDPEEQQYRFKRTIRYMNKLKKQHIPAIPDDFLEALNYFPETSGVAMGMDRLAMFFTNTTDIRDVLLFPFCEYFPEHKGQEAALRKKDW
ncbi:MAG: hypothetical protein HY957_11285 [Nitrospirae bacterium]|nr:hypothetical protein [Nitrospirota bacterium]